MKKLITSLAIISFLAVGQIEATANHIRNIINNSKYCVRLATTASKIKDLFTNSTWGTRGYFVVPANQTVTPTKDFQTLNPQYSDETPALTIDVLTPLGTKTSTLSNDGRSSFLTNSSSGPISANTDINLVIGTDGAVTQVPAT